MSQPPVPGHGPGAEPGRGSGMPGGPPAAPGQDPRLAGFAQGGPWDACPPGPGLAAAVAALSGPDWHCPGATDDELAGLLGRWAAVEAWAAAGKLGVMRELIRRRALRGAGTHGDLPDAWDDGLSHEVTAALAVSLPAADKLASLAWELEARLPGIGAALAAGTIDYLKATLIVKELTVLDDAHIAAAEQMIVGELAGKTPGQLARLAVLAVGTVDPDGARKRREHAEREDARVRLWRERTGASALAAYGLPTDAALAANANIDQRAQEYKKAGIYPDARMDQLRVAAFADILNGVSAATRIAQAQAEAQAQAGTQNQAQAQDQAHTQDDAGPGAGPQPNTPAGRNGGHPDGQGPGSQENRPRNDSRPRDDGSATDDGGPAGDHEPHDDGGDQASPADGDSDGGPGGGDGGPGDDGPGPGGGPGSGGPGSDGHGVGGGSGAGAAPGTGDAGPVLPAKSNLTLPLATLLRLADRPGEAHGLGPLDPALARDLAAAAARSPHSEWCITITDTNGYAIGHGCAKPVRTKRGTSPPVNTRDGPWALTRHEDPGPPGGFGTWTLTLPDGRQLTVKLGPIPVTDCDHRYESHGYQPSDTLRHLVEIRDGTCTFPSCSRHARACDFEHAVPYDQGGRTCACNAGARSRRCHKVKQSRGWKVTQPRPGWHQWQTPSGRIYTNGPMKYPA